MIHWVGASFHFTDSVRRTEHHLCPAVGNSCSQIFHSQLEFVWRRYHVRVLLSPPNIVNAYVNHNNTRMLFNNVFVNSFLQVNQSVAFDTSTNGRYLVWPIVTLDLLFYQTEVA